MTITITIQKRGLSPGELTNVYSKYLEMRRAVGYDKVQWDEGEEKEE